MSEDLIGELRIVQELVDYRSYAAGVIGKAIREIEAADNLEAVLREIRDAPVGALRRDTVREIARRALDGER